MNDPNAGLRATLSQLLALQSQGRHQEVAASCEQLLRQQPGSPALIMLLASSLRMAGRLTQAQSVLDALPGRAQQLPEVQVERARLLMQAGEGSAATATYLAALDGRREDPDLWKETARAAMVEGDDAAADRMLAALDAAPAQVAAPAAASVATLLLSLGRQDDAAACVERAAAAAPDASETLYARAALRRAQGDFAGAAEDYRELQRMQPERLDLLPELAAIQRYEDPDDPDLDSLRAALARADVPEEAKERLGYALAKALDDVGDHAGAHAAVSDANRRRRQRMRPWDAVAERQRAALMRELFPDADALGEPGRPGAGPTPLLVVGLPRSGTSLVEQMLASHPAVSGAGETTVLPGYLFAAPLDRETLARRLDADQLDGLRAAYPAELARRGGAARWVVDKYPANFQLIGPFLRAFPEGRVIHCQRDLRDTAVSLLLQDFPMGNRYANDPATVVAYAELYRELMDHWLSLADPRLLSVSYEALVADPEPALRAMLELLDLDYDPACLGFQDTARAVTTLSSWQVRQPLSDRAVRRWEAYAPFWGESFEQLDALQR